MGWETRRGGSERLLQDHARLHRAAGQPLFPARLRVRRRPYPHQLAAGLRAAAAQVPPLGAFRPRAGGPRRPVQVERQALPLERGLARLAGLDEPRLHRLAAGGHVLLGGRIQRVGEQRLLGTARQGALAGAIPPQREAGVRDCRGAGEQGHAPHLALLGRGVLQHLLPEADGRFQNLGPTLAAAALGPAPGLGLGAGRGRARYIDRGAHARAPVGLLDSLELLELRD